MILEKLHFSCYDHRLPFYEETFFLEFSSVQLCQIFRSNMTCLFNRMQTNKIILSLVFWRLRAVAILLVVDKMFSMTSIDLQINVNDSKIKIFPFQ